MLEYLEQYLPPIDHQHNLSESTLDYLDDLQDYLVMKSNIFWDFLKGFSYTDKTNEWIQSAEDMLREFLTIMPFQEILNLIDAVMLNFNDKRALILIRYEWALRRNVKIDPVTFTNAKDILKYGMEGFGNAFTIIQQILHKTVTGEEMEVHNINMHY